MEKETAWLYYSKIRCIFQSNFIVSRQIKRYIRSLALNLLDVIPVLWYNHIERVYLSSKGRSGETANKTSIGFFENIPVRAVWDEESAKWWFCAMDIAEALTKTTNPRVYWATVKRRNPQLIAICKQLKLKAKSEHHLLRALCALNKWL